MLTRLYVDSASTCSLPLKRVLRTRSSYAYCRVRTQSIQQRLVRSRQFQNAPYRASYARHGLKGQQDTQNRSQHRRFSAYRALVRANFTLWWANSPEFRRFTYITGGAVLCFAACGIERAPVTRRWRFNCVPDWLLERLAEDAYQEWLTTFGQEVLLESAPETRRLQRVLGKLVSCSGIPRIENSPWTVQAVRNEEIRAFITPGRHIFVFSGMLRLADNDDELAALLGHEVGHEVARHLAESLSHYAVFSLAGTWLLTVLFNVSSSHAQRALDLAYKRPFSRIQESEADYIGLMTMAAACYDARATLPFWHRVARANPDKVAEFLSTHPSNANRIRSIQNWMPQALEMSRSGGCSATNRLAHDFASTAAFTQL